MGVKYKLLWQRILANSLFVILADAIIFIASAFYFECEPIAFPVVLIRMLALLALFPAIFSASNLLFSRRIHAYFCTFLLIYLGIAVISSLLSPREAEIIEMFVELHSEIELFVLMYFPFVISFWLTYLLDFLMLRK